MAERALRPADAERWCRRAIELDEQIGNPKEIAPDYSNLAGLLLTQGRLDEAEGLAQRAVAIDETLDLSAEPWKDYSILAQIAERRGRVDEARAWRRKERESFAAFAGSAQQIARWQPVIAAVIAACQGNQEARGQVEALCDQLAQRDDWKHLATAIRLILAGARDDEALPTN